MHTLILKDIINNSNKTQEIVSIKFHEFVAAGDYNLDYQNSSSQNKKY